MSPIVIHRVEPNICTCGAHPGGECRCDSSYCDSGAAYIAEDGSLWRRLSGSLNVEQVAANRSYLREHR